MPSVRKTTPAFPGSFPLPPEDLPPPRTVRTPHKKEAPGKPAGCRASSCTSSPPKGEVEHCGQGKILPGIIQNPQIIHQYAYFISLKIPFPAHRISRNPFFRQHRGKALRPSLYAPCKNHNIPVPAPVCRRPRPGHIPFRCLSVP